MSTQKPKFKKLKKIFNKCKEFMKISCLAASIFSSACMFTPTYINRDDYKIVSGTATYHERELIRKLRELKNDDRGLSNENDEKKYEFFESGGLSIRINVLGGDKYEDSIGIIPISLSTGILPKKIGGNTIGGNTIGGNTNDDGLKIDGSIGFSYTTFRSDHYLHNFYPYFTFDIDKSEDFKNYAGGLVYNFGFGTKGVGKYEYRGVMLKAGSKIEAGNNNAYIGGNIGLHFTLNAKLDLELPSFFCLERRPYKCYIIKYFGIKIHERCDDEVFISFCSREPYLSFSFELGPMVSYNKIYDTGSITTGGVYLLIRSLWIITTASAGYIPELKTPLFTLFFGIDLVGDYASVYSTSYCTSLSTLRFLIQPNDTNP